MKSFRFTRSRPYRVFTEFLRIVTLTRLTSTGFLPSSRKGKTWLLRNSGRWPIFRLTEFLPSFRAKSGGLKYLVAVPLCGWRPFFSLIRGAFLRAVSFNNFDSFRHLLTANGTRESFLLINSMIPTCSSYHCSPPSPSLFFPLIACFGTFLKPWAVFLMSYKKNRVFRKSWLIIFHILIDGIKFVARPGIGNLILASFFYQVSNQSLVALFSFTINTSYSLELFYRYLLSRYEVFSLDPFFSGNEF